MALTDPCKEKQPRVIDNDMLYTCINSQLPKGELGRLTNEERMPLEEVEEIRLEFKNILRIDHLWVMPALTKLQLNNNMIQTIENLEVLVNLKELDLSFNRIGKIQNLDTLTKLVKITLFDNLIETLENMNHQKDLTVFSIGRNKISESINVYYMRRFPKLTSLNMAHNPCAESDKFRNFIAVFLPKLVYYEYIRITDLEREVGQKIFEYELKQLTKVEEVEYAEKERKDREREEAERNSLSFVEYLNNRHLFDQMFENDVDGKALLDIGDEVKDYYEEYEEQFLALCNQVFDAGQRHYKIRQTEVDEFLATVEEGKRMNQEESISVMEDFLEKKHIIFDNIKEFQNDFEKELISAEKYYEDTENLSDEFKNVLHSTWKDLMKLELQLYEQVDEVNQNFGHVLNDLINAFLEEAQGIISQIRSLEVNYFENVGEVAYRVQVNVTMGIETVPSSLKEMMSEREVVTNALAASHDLHMLAIDNREDLLVNRAKTYAENFTTTQIQDEIKRNRYKLLEVIHYLDIQEEELSDLTNGEAIILDIDDLDF